MNMRKLPGWLGFALLMLAVSSTVMITMPLRRENAEILHENMAREPLPHRPLSSSARLSRELEVFSASLPGADDINEVLNGLHDLAGRHRLSLENSTYKTEQNRSGDIMKLHISVKTEGEYADLRQFLDEIGHRLPSLAVKQLSFSRQKISDTKLDTVIEFVLYYSRKDIRQRDAQTR